MITKENIRLHELVGLAAQASGPCGVHDGIVVDETRNMMILDTAAGRRMLPKAGRTWRLGGHEVPGGLLAGRPHERLRRR